MTKAEVVEQCRWFAKESRVLAEAFQPRHGEREAILVPIAMCRQLADALENIAKVMENIAQGAEEAA